MKPQGPSFSTWGWQVSALFWQLGSFLKFFFFKLPSACVFSSPSGRSLSFQKHNSAPSLTATKGSASILWVLRLYGRSGGMQWCQTTEQELPSFPWIFFFLSYWTPHPPPIPAWPCLTPNWFCTFQPLGSQHPPSRAVWVQALFSILWHSRPQRVLGLLICGDHVCCDNRRSSLR